MVHDINEPICVDCRKIPPPTNTSYTLVSSAHGWRLTRAVNRDGQYEAEWRCPECWKRRKAALATNKP